MIKLTTFLGSLALSTSLCFAMDPLTPETPRTPEKMYNLLREDYPHLTKAVFINTYLEQGTFERTKKYLENNKSQFLKQELFAGMTSTTCELSLKDFDKFSTFAQASMGLIASGNVAEWRNLISFQFTSTYLHATPQQFEDVYSDLLGPYRHQKKEGTIDTSRCTDINLQLSAMKYMKSQLDKIIADPKGPIQALVEETKAFKRLKEALETYNELSESLNERTEYKRYVEEFKALQRRNEPLKEQEVLIKLNGIINEQKALNGLMKSLKEQNVPKEHLDAFHSQYQEYANIQNPSSFITPYQKQRYIQDQAALLLTPYDRKEAIEKRKEAIEKRKEALAERKADREKRRAALTERKAALKSQLHQDAADENSNVILGLEKSDKSTVTLDPVSMYNELTQSYPQLTLEQFGSIFLECDCDYDAIKSVLKHKYQRVADRKEDSVILKKQLHQRAVHDNSNHFFGLEISGKDMFNFDPTPSPKLHEYIQTLYREFNKGLVRAAFDQQPEVDDIPLDCILVSKDIYSEVFSGRLQSDILPKLQQAKSDLHDDLTIRDLNPVCRSTPWSFKIVTILDLQNKINATQDHIQLLNSSR